MRTTYAHIAYNDSVAGDHVVLTPFERSNHPTDGLKRSILSGRYWLNTPLEHTAVKGEMKLNA
jgi:hypothetical protein